ncbi:AraC family ligand binding domain-containing protein [Mucilaginibacter sp. CAU 1740]|uniref:AraC family ligand binding domain-containing protein n=1 Tax=Mucilaginibacter sp. CAU 1740 TaxID=3140365 RepID=UPI00325B3CBD
MNTINITKHPDTDAEALKISMNIIFNKKVDGGNISIIEQHIPYTAGVALNLCNNHDKVVYVAEGSFRFFAGGRYYNAIKGASLFIPKGILHSYKNEAPQTGKVLVTLTPGGNNGFLNSIERSVQLVQPGQQALPATV